MRKIIAAAFVSLDGVMQAPGGPEEDSEGKFEYGGWTFYYFDEALGASMGELFDKPFDLLLGRKTYDIFAGYWPKITDPDNTIAGPFNSTRKYVATRSPDRKLDWNNSESLGADIVASLKRLKGDDGPDLLIQGSADMIQTLLANNLIDEFNLLIFPLVLGKGKRLFGDGTIPAAFKLTSTTAYPAGVIRAKYEPAGEIRTGSFA